MGAEGIVRALATLGEAGEAAGLAQGADTLAPAGEDLVRVGLAADIPDQAIFRRVELGMDRHRKLDHAETGAQMAAGHRYRIDGFGAQFIGELAQFVLRQEAQIGRRVDRIEQRHYEK